MRCSNSVEHQRSSRGVLERSSSSVSGSVAHREVNNAAQDPHRDAVRHRLQTTGHTATPHTTHSPMDLGVAGWHSKATRCPRRWYITMISDLSIPSRQMELAEGARPRGARLVREEDACGIPSSVDDETASNASETSLQGHAQPPATHRVHASVSLPCTACLHVGIDIFV